MEKIIVCIYCGQKLRIRSDKEGWATCPKCKKTFLTNVRSSNTAEKKESYIKHMEPAREEALRKMEEQAANRKPNYYFTEDPDDPTFNKIMLAVQDYVGVAMKMGGSIPDIHHYYYSHSYGYSDIPDDSILKEDSFDNIGYATASIIKDKLEKAIINEIGYKYCEVRLLEKTFSEDYVDKNFWGDRVYKKRSTTGTAIWIRASMNLDSFNRYEPNPIAERYEKRRGRDNYAGFEGL